MSLVSTIKSILGLGGSDRTDERGTTVTVEREAGGTSESAGRSATDSTDEVGTDESADAAGAVESTEEATGSEVESAETTEEEVPVEPEDGDEPVESISGIGPAYAERLASVGIETVGDLASADAASVAGETDIPETRVADWIERAESN